MTGRAVSAAIHQRLRDALASGKPHTYQELADIADCTVRSVRNYLARSQDIFGFPIRRERDSEHRVVVRAVGLESNRAPTSTPDPFGDALLHALFPDEATSRSTPPIIVAFHDFPSYGTHQRNIARRWAAACASNDRNANVLRLDPMRPAEITLWPICVVVHDIDGIVLVGLAAQDDANHVAVVPLSRVVNEPGALRAVEPERLRDRDVESSELLAALHLPFRAGTPQPDDIFVDVHVRFDPRLAEALRERRWHPRQRVTMRKSGELDVQFDAVPLRAAASWVSGYGEGVRVVGDKKLRKAVKKSAFLP